MKALRPLIAAAALLLALAGQLQLGAPAEAAGLPGVRALRVTSQADHAATVAWSAPDTSRVVVRYRVVWGDHLVRLSPAARSYTVTGLRNGVAVTVAVRPVYRSGARGERRTVQVTPYGPIRAVSVSAAEVSGQRGVVTWSFGIDPNGRPVNWVLRRQPTNSTSWVTVQAGTSGARHFTQSGTETLTAGMTYAYRLDVTAPDRAGRTSTAYVTTSTPATPTVYASKGAAVAPGSGCSGSCWYVQSRGLDFPSPATCGLRRGDTDAPFGATWTQSNSWIQTPNWLGPGVPFYVSCSNGARSRTYTF